MNSWDVFKSKLYRKLPTLAYDALAIPLAWYLAFILRYNLQPFPPSVITIHSFYALIVIFFIQLSSYYLFKVYRGLWNFSSLNDVKRIVKASIAATAVSILTVYLANISLPRSILPLYSLIIITILCTGRLFKRSFFDKKEPFSNNQNIKKVVIIGAGRAGGSLVRDLKRLSYYQILGFIDDNPQKLGLEIHGVRVIGSVEKLAEFSKKHQIDLIFIAIPSATSASMRKIVERCEKTKVTFRTLPSLSALASGRVEVNALRRVSLEDLLGRDQVVLEWQKITHQINDKRVLVTGGGGSIGSELCRQLIKLTPRELVIVDNCEFNLYRIEQELRKTSTQTLLACRLISITDETAINILFNTLKPQLVFHAAAYKHVPLLEQQARVALCNNVIGTQIVAEASVTNKVEKMILISTDKAVNPTNIMGMTKRIAEVYCQNLNQKVDTQFITVRFGNVLGSTGSVVPLFQQQLMQGGPLTVTHPQIERYFMMIPEACQLILQTLTQGQGGEIFVLDMGEPIKINYLAEQLIRLAGKEPNKDIAIVYTGLRPGEKLFEELFHAQELLTPTNHQKVFKAKVRLMDWNYLNYTLKLIKNACDLHDDQTLLKLMQQLVPEFNSQVVKKSQQITAELS